MTSSGSFLKATTINKSGESFFSSVKKSLSIKLFGCRILHEIFSANFFIGDFLILSPRPDFLSGDVTTEMILFEESFKSAGDDPRVHKNKVRVRALGHRELLPERVKKAIDYAESKTKN